MSSRAMTGHAEVAVLSDRRRGPQFCCESALCIAFWSKVIKTMAG